MVDLRDSNTNQTETPGKKGNYTLWQREHFDGMSVDELVDAAAEYERSHPFQGAKAKLLGE